MLRLINMLTKNKKEEYIEAQLYHFTFIWSSVPGAGSLLRLQLYCVEGATVEDDAMHATIISDYCYTSDVIYFSVNPH